MYRDDFLQKKLNERKENHSYRELRISEGKTDFCSNDYLGMVTNRMLDTNSGALNSGSMGSRLIAGNYQLIEEIEKQIAQFHQSEAALLFNSGYDANIGLLSSVPQKGDTILYDQLCHASIRDGIRLSFAHSFSFQHNDMVDLERKLELTKGTLFIVTESVFSMDGDYCPLKQLVSLSAKYNAHLIIDEAHATGIVGEKGEGLVQQLNLQEAVFARMHSFGKALGCHGAAIVGSVILRNYLINFARPFIYSTALPAHSVALIGESYRLFPSMHAERMYLMGLINQFRAAALPFAKLDSFTPIQVVMIPGNVKAKRVAKQLQDEELDVRAILYPTIPREKERLRIVLHAFNTHEQVSNLIRALNH